MPLRARPAFTLLELLVALVVISAGLLALVGATTMLVGRQTELHARFTAGELAGNRLQLLAASACASRAGTASLPAFTEYWSETDAGASLRELRDSVTYAAFGTLRAFTLTTRLTC